MYKKIMFLIITLSIIINVGNSTVVMAKENIVTEISKDSTCDDVYENDRQSVERRGTRP